jgi:uncharacterized protein YegL
LFDDIIFAENPEPRCPCVLLLDTSASMLGPPIRALNASLHDFRRELLNDQLASLRVELAVVAFGERVETLVPFTAPDNFHPPTLRAGGDTPLGAALSMAMALLEARKSDYRRNGVSYFRPWLFLLSDGSPTDAWQAAAESLKASERAGALSFFAVAIPPATSDVLRQLGTRAPLSLSGLRFSDLFAWLSRSLKSVSSSRPGDSIGLENPMQAGWARDDHPPTATETHGVAVLDLRCRKTRRSFTMRVDKRGDGGWVATYCEANDDGISGTHAQTVPAFEYATEYPGCPHCKSRGMFICGCEALACWDGVARRVQCPTCREHITLGAHVTSVNARRG